MTRSIESGGQTPEKPRQPALIDFLALKEGEKINIKKVEMRVSGEENFSPSVLITKSALADTSDEKLAGSMVATRELTEEARKWFLEQDEHPSEEEVKRLVPIASQLLKILIYFDSFKP